MKAVEHKRLLTQLGLDAKRVQNMVIADLLKRYKEEFITEDEFKCEMISVDYMRLDGPIKMTKVSGDILDKATVIIK